MEPKVPYGRQKTIPRNIKKHIQKRSAPGCQPAFGLLGPDHLFSRFMLKITNVGAKIDAKTHQTSMPEQAPNINHGNHQKQYL